MQKIKNFLVSIIIALVAVLIGQDTAFAATSPTLVGSSGYSVLGGSTVTNTDSTTTTGAVGVSAGTAITGFPPGIAGGGTHSNDSSAISAQSDNLSAFGILDQTCDYTYADGQDLTLLSPLGPGVYCATGGFALSGNLTLIGSGVWIFKSDSTLITATNSSVTGGDPCNVWWRVGSSATLGTTSSLIGNILALTSITMNTGATLNGRALAQNGAVTLDTNTISGPTCSVTPSNTATLTLVKTIVGGTKTFAEFPLTATGPTTITGDSATPAVTNATVTAGSYTLSELTQSDYAAGTWSCIKNTDPAIVDSSISLADSDNAICTIQNTYIAPSSGSGGSYSGTSVAPLIDIIKLPSPLALPNGPGLVEYTYTVSNIGTVPMTSVTAIDDNCSPVRYVSGDINNDSKLDTTEKWTYVCSATLSATHTNTVVATGWANGVSATHIASATVVVGSSIVPPLIHVTKVPNILALSASGGIVTYTNKVTNPGTVSLSNIQLVDDKCTSVKYISGDTNGDSKLDVNETWTYTCNANLTKTTTNTVVATGQANGLTARDFAITTVVVASPSLPNTGFPPEKKNAWIVAIIVSIILLILTSIFVIQKKRTV